MSDYTVIAIGLLAQLLFSARLLVQWIASERARKVLSPTLFWQLSMIASFTLCIYGWLRNDFAIILGQLVSYYIYIWNLQAKGWWGQLHKATRITFLSVPLAAIVYFLADWDATMTHLFKQEDIPMGLILFGIAGQFTFTLRFIYQWYYSRKAGESLLPLKFWLISITGSVMIISYALMRKDPVIILGQATGFVVYLRNIMIGCRAEKRAKEQPGMESGN